MQRLKKAKLELTLKQADADAKAKLEADIKRNLPQMQKQSQMLMQKVET
jgi:hypothetical protein